MPTVVSGIERIIQDQSITINQSIVNWSIINNGILLGMYQIIRPFYIQYPAGCKIWLAGYSRLATRYQIRPDVQLFPFFIVHPTALRALAIVTSH